MKDIALVIHSLLQSDLTGYTGLEHQTKASSYLLAEVIRKLEPDDSSVVDTRTWQSFLDSNEKCRQWKMTDSILAGNMLERARSFIHSQFDMPEHDFLYENVLPGMDLGPGVNLGGHPSCSYPLKLQRGLTGRANLLHLFDALYRLTPYRFYPGPGRSVKEASSVSFVPKTTKSSRMICTEPTVNMLFQRGVSSIIEFALKRNGIDLSTQPTVNSNFAKLGSSDNSYATIDLSSASDSISLGLAEFLLPARMLAWIKATRSHTTSYKGVDYPLHMVSTMGNGYTFSLQTMIFYSIAVSCCEGERVNVFGDDIIVPTRYAERVLHCLREAGFTPNPSKTFIDGPFRESCGTDFFLGIDIRPHYIKRLKTVQDLCVHINRLRAWSYRLGIPIPMTERYFLELITKLRLVRTHPAEGDDAGIKDLECPEPFHKFHFKQGPKHSHHILDTVYFYYKYQYKPSSLYFINDKMVGAFKDAFLKLEPNQLLSAFLRGTIRENRVSFRDKPNRPRRYEVVRTYTTIPW